jgi:hypothetical protein
MGTPSRFTGNGFVFSESMRLKADKLVNVMEKRGVVGSALR